MNGFVKRQKIKSGAVAEYKRYRCGAKFTEYHNGACISESVVEEYLLTHAVEQLELDILNMQQQQKKMMKKPDESVSIRAELDRLNNMYQKGRIKEEYYDEQYAILSEKLKDCMPSADIVTSLEAYKAISSIFSNGWQEMYRGLDIRHKKAFWKEIIREINVDAKSRKICGFHFRV